MIPALCEEMPELDAQTLLRRLLLDEPESMEIVRVLGNLLEHYGCQPPYLVRRDGHLTLFDPYAPEPEQPTFLQRMCFRPSAGNPQRTGRLGIAQRAGHSGSPDGKRAERMGRRSDARMGSGFCDSLFPEARESRAPAGRNDAFVPRALEGVSPGGQKHSQSMESERERKLWKRRMKRWN